MVQKKIKVVQVLGGLFCGGTEAFVMNIARNIDREKTEVDYIIHDASKGHYDDEVLSLGSKIIRIPDRTEVGVFKYFKVLFKTLKEIKPDVVHAHAMFNSGAVMLAAKLAGVKIRICHAHGGGDEGEKKISRKIHRFFMRKLINFCSSSRVACNEKSAYFLFGKHSLLKDVNFLSNSIDVDRFTIIDNNSITKLRKELNISEDKYVIGFVGRLVDVKNILFYVKLFDKVKSLNEKSVLIIVGEGPHRSKIEEILISKDLQSNSRILGNRSDVPDLMALFDLLILPSRFEGIPFVAIEAQAKGIPCLISSNIEKTVDLGLGLINFLPLEKRDEWIKYSTGFLKKEKDVKRIKSVFEKEGYDFSKTLKQISRLYELER
ncbi:glycosyltransferase [Bacillus sp. UMB0893]|uniref:glycosyltransferase n=1 Tax=Bacillus sp. UMB0893 TaxID=2066053 RepID=UPI000C76DC0D|nr:glycosyltransferase [Bacillus sp. UMB0893]PLR68738.1 hypothetical protein CYJ36_07210 [Bacillus sp. UMB0893]